MQGRTALIATAFACVGLAGGHWLGMRHQQATLEALGRRLAATEGRIERLERAPSRGESRSVSNPRAAGPHWPRSTLDAPLSPDAVPAPEELQRLARSRGAALESAFRAQTVDPAWAPGAERSLLRAVAAPELALVQAPPTRVEAQCRRTACRVRARFDDPAELETWLQGYLLVAVDAIARSESVQERDASGGVAVTIYGSRR